MFDAKLVKCLVFVAAVSCCCVTRASADSELTALNGHDFWKQLSNGFRGLEEVALKLAAPLQHALNQAVHGGHGGPAGPHGPHGLDGAEVPGAPAKTAVQPSFGDPIKDILLKDSSEEEKDDKSSEESTPEDEDLDFDIGLPGPADDFGLANGFLGPLFNFGNFANNMIWWKGPNVCVTREEVDETPEGSKKSTKQDSKPASKEEEDDDDDDDEESRGLGRLGGLGGLGGFGGFGMNYHFSSCSQTRTKYECVTRMSNHGVLKRLVTSYRCCHGSRRQFGKPGCTPMDLGTLLETARDMGGVLFAKMLTSAGLDDMVSVSGNATLFLPTDDAMRDYIDGMQDQNRVRRAVQAVLVSDDETDDFARTVRRREPEAPAAAALSSSAEGGADLSPESVERVDKEDNAAATAATTTTTTTTTTTVDESTSVPSWQENQVPNQGHDEAPKDDRRGPQARTDDPMAEELADLADRTLVLAHRVDGLLDLHEVRNDAVLNTTANTTIRINVFPGPMGRTVTANCARVTKDNAAVGGVVHLVDQVLKPVPPQRTLASLLQSDPRLSTMRTLFENAGMMALLREAGPMTIFVPSNEAFKHMDPQLRSNILREDSCVGSFVRHLVFKHTICTAAAALRVQAPNLDGEYVTLERTASDDGKLLLDGTEVGAHDIMASNGVLHILNKVLLPDSARPLKDLLKSRNMTRWHDLLEKADLLNELNTASNVTLFVPNDKALQTPEAELLLSSGEGPEALRRALRYHMTHPALEADHLNNDQLLRSHLEGEQLRVNLYTTLPFLSGAVTRATVQCGRIVSINHKACGAVMHEVDKVLSPASGTVLDLLDRDEFSVLRDIVKASSYHKYLSAAEGSPSHFTFLAPTNTGFEKLNTELLEKLKSDQEQADSFVKRHILPSSLCCSGVGETSWPFTNRVATLSENVSHRLRKDAHNRIHIGDAVVQQCDKMASNGIVHVVDMPLIPPTMRPSTSPPNRRQNQNVEILLFGL